MRCADELAGAVAQHDGIGDADVGVAVADQQHPDAGVASRRRASLRPRTSPDARSVAARAWTPRMARLMASRSRTGPAGTDDLDLGRRT